MKWTRTQKYVLSRNKLYCVVLSRCLVLIYISTCISYLKLLFFSILIKPNIFLQAYLKCRTFGDRLLKMSVSKNWRLGRIFGCECRTCLPNVGLMGPLKCTHIWFHQKQIHLQCRIWYRRRCLQGSSRTVRITGA